MGAATMFTVAICLLLAGCLESRERVVSLEDGSTPVRSGRYERHFIRTDDYLKNQVPEYPHFVKFQKYYISPSAKLDSKTGLPVQVSDGFVLRELGDGFYAASTLGYTPVLGTSKLTDSFASDLFYVSGNTIHVWGLACGSLDQFNIKSKNFEVVEGNRCEFKDRTALVRTLQEIKDHLMRLPSGEIRFQTALLRLTWIGD